MKSTIIEAADSLVLEGRFARALGTMGVAAAIAAGTPALGSADQASPSRTTPVEFSASEGKIVFSPSFLDFIKKEENSIKAGWNEQEKKWYPHDSPEGGRQTIAYGHKIKSDTEQRRFDKGITEQEALGLLKKDLSDAWDRAAEYVEGRHGVNLANLSEKQQEMLTDYAYNLGTLRGFPKFTKAVVEQDWDTVRREYKRTYKDSKGKRHELARNKAFYDRYLKS
jgi:GH24 family phage-related lysozyme (muramidase)